MSKNLRNLISFRNACRAIIGINLAVIGFHLLVITKIVPYTVVWGGRLKTVDEMYVFESVSILINLLLVFSVLRKSKKIEKQRSHKLIDLTLWIFVLLFALNTIGNLTSETSIETYVATPITAILAILCWRVAVEKVKEEPENQLTAVNNSR